MNNLGALLESALAQSPAVLEGYLGESLVGIDMVARANAIAKALRRFGVLQDELVLLLIRNQPLDIVGYLAIWLTGGVAVPVHAETLKENIEALRQRTGARFAIRSGEIEPWSSDAPRTRQELSGAAIVVFTSGSTGKPKGVIVGHQALYFKLGVLSKLLTLRASDLVVVPLQLTFIFGIWVTLLGLLAGSRIVLVSKFAADAAALLPSATILAAVPTMLRAIRAREDAIVAPLLRKILTGGEPLGPSLATSLGVLFPSASIYDLFGLTETGSCDFCLGPAGQPHGLGTIGWPTEGVEYRIVAGAEHSPGVGELQIKTPSIMLGYLDEPEMTANALDASYFRTGDLARQREDGLVELIGRSKDIISRGGNKIAPLEIDHLFAQHTSVIAAISFGVADERLGEALHILIVKKPGCSETEQTMREWAAGRIEKFKLPDAIHFCDTLPLGNTGKADRKTAASVIAERLRFHRSRLIIGHRVKSHCRKK